MRAVWVLGVVFWAGVALADDGHPPLVELPQCPAMDTEGVSKPLVVFRVDPAYPAICRRFGLETTLVFDAMIDDQGRLAHVHAHGDQFPGVGFKQSAMSALHRWRFTPAIVDGEPRACWIRISVVYRLEASAPEIASTAPSALPPEG